MSQLAPGVDWPGARWAKHYCTVLYGREEECSPITQLYHMVERGSIVILLKCMLWYRGVVYFYYSTVSLLERRNIFTLLNCILVRKEEYIPIT